MYSSVFYLQAKLIKNRNRWTFLSCWKWRHAVLLADDVIPDWPAARGSGGEFVCWIIQGVKSIWIKFANLMANSLSRRDGASFIPWVTWQPHLPFTSYQQCLKYFLSTWRNLTWEAQGTSQGVCARKTQAVHDLNDHLPRSDRGWQISAMHKGPRRDASSVMLVAANSNCSNTLSCFVWCYQIVI